MRDITFHAEATHFINLPNLHHSVNRTPVFEELFDQAEKVFPSMVDLCKQLSVIGYVDTVTEPHLIPLDNQDGFFCSSWQRPSDYLDEQYRNGISSFRLMDAQRLEVAITRLGADLKSGRWHERHGKIRDLDKFDGGYTFAAANKPLERTRLDRSVEK